MPVKFTKALLGTLLLGASLNVAAADQTLLNSSFDVSREFFNAYNPVFAKHWQEKTGKTVDIKQSHAGSSAQARSILQGLPADVVTFNQVTDVQVLHDRGKLIPDNWQQLLPNASSPYYSTIAFLVRKGNPKQISDWGDLVKDEVKLVFPNPKTSGNARYTYLAALGFAQKNYGKENEAALDGFLKKFLGNVAVFDTGGRGATTSFVERGIGDVLITFESEVNNIRHQYGAADYQVVVPKTSILAQFPVAVVEKNTKRNGTQALATEYLSYLYSEESQRLLAGFNYRVHNEKVAAEFTQQLPAMELMTVEQIIGSWDNAMKTHFANGTKLDQLLKR